jgi:transposase
LGEAVTEQLHIEVKAKVLQNVRFKYACRHCDRTGINTPVVLAPMPAQPLPGSIATASTLAFALVHKYVDGTPLYRLAQAFERAGVPVSRGALGHWVISSSERHLSRIYEALKLRLRSQPLIHGDETTVQVLKEKDREATSTSYMWAYRSGEDSNEPIIDNLLGFIEEAVDVLFALRRKTMEPRQRQLFLELDHAGAERFLLGFQRGDFGSIGRQLRHQFRNAGFAGSDHQILESEPHRRVNRRSRKPSAGDLVLPNRMADHSIDIDAVENPMELLGQKRHHRSLPARPSEPVFRQSLQDHHKTQPIEEQQLHSVAAAIAKGKDRRRKRVERHRLLHQDSKAVDARAKVDRLAVQVDFQVSAQSEHEPTLR